MLARVVLSDGSPTLPTLPPRPASLFVVVELGHSFRALPLDERRRLIEQGLTDALGIAIEKVEDSHVADARAGAAA